MYVSQYSVMYADQFCQLIIVFFFSLMGIRDLVRQRMLERSIQLCSRRHSNTAVEAPPPPAREACLHDHKSHRTVGQTTREEEDNQGGHSHPV